MPTSRYARPASPAPVTPTAPGFQIDPKAIVSGMAALSIAAVAALYSLYQYNQQSSVIAFASSDISTSSQVTLSKFYSVHCLALVNKLRSGDDLGVQQFANVAVLTELKTVENTLGLGKVCDAAPQASPQENGVGNANGTSPIRALEGILNQVKARRAAGDQRPVVINMLLHEAEPVVSQEGFTAKQMAALVKQMADTNIFVAVSVPGAELQQSLQEAFADNPRARVFPTMESDTAVNWVFAQARAVKPQP